MVEGDNHFSIDSKNGTLYMLLSADREATSKYVMTVQALDNGPVVRSATVTVTVTVTDKNDNAPLFSSEKFTKSVTENAATGTSLGRIEATDIDEGANGDVVYTMTSANLQLSTYIALSSSTGELTIKGMA